MALNVGDRVVLVGNRAGGAANQIPSGTNGTICVVCDDSSYNYGVEWDIAFQGGHDCDGLSKDGHGRFVFASEIEFVPSDDETDVDISGLM